MKFTELPYSRPDTDKLIADIEKLTQEFKQATSAEQQIAINKQMDEVSTDFTTMSSLAHIRYTINTKDTFYSDEKKFFDSFSPTLHAKFVEYNKIIVASPFLDELKKEYGELMFINIDLSIKGFSDDIIELSKAEAEIRQEYQSLYASAKVEWEGKEIPLPMLGAYKQSLDRDTRYKAFTKEGEFFDSHREKFDELFDKLVKNRTEQAKKLGYDNFVELAYIQRKRNCYSPEDVAVFRQEVVNTIVPLVSKLHKEQAERLKLDKLQFHDVNLLFIDGNPDPIGTADELLKNAISMYKEMSPDTKEFIELMEEKELFDLVSRDGKAPGGYCSSLKKYKYPFIFSNFNGTAGDVDVLTHEAGHAFANYVASRTIDIPDYRHASMEACEVHSMTMEFLTAPWHHLFFKENTDKYTFMQVATALEFIPYGCCVDHFQEEIYKNPDITPQQRNELWDKLNKIYQPDMDFADIPFYSRGARWQRQLHVYLYPFYYIDYCFAQSVAMQMWEKNLSDAKGAWDTYLTFTKMGGTKTFIDLVVSSGLNSPIKAGSLSKVVSSAEKWLAENNPTGVNNG